MMISLLANQDLMSMLIIPGFVQVCGLLGKVLEFEMSFQGHLKLLENDNFSLKIDNNP